MLTIEEIIEAKDLKKLFYDSLIFNEVVNKSKIEVIKKIRAFAPLNKLEFEIYYDDKDIIGELNRFKRYSILKHIQKKQ